MWILAFLMAGSQPDSEWANSRSTSQVTINRIPQIGKIFAMHEKQSVESKVSRADNFVHPDHEPE